MTPLEKAIVSLLVCAGLVGAVLAYFHFARLRLDLATAQEESAREAVRLRMENQKLELAEKEQELAAALPPPAGEAAPSAGMHSAADSRADRMAALASLANTLVRGGNSALGEARFQSALANLRAESAARRGLALDTVAPAYFLAETGQLSPRFGELFALPPEQVDQLQQALRAAAAKADDRILATTQLKDNGGGNYTLETPALADSAIAADRDRMMELFQQTLGARGFEAFLLLNGGTDPRGANVVTRLYDSFGGTTRTTTISRNQGGGYRFSTRSGSGGRSGVAPSLESVQGQAGVAIKLLPPGF